MPSYIAESTGAGGVDDRDPLDQTPRRCEVEGIGIVDGGVGWTSIRRAPLGWLKMGTYTIRFLPQSETRILSTPHLRGFCDVLLLPNYGTQIG
jgi:hypothetical protein